MGLFTGTAEYYDKYRPGLPAEVVSVIMQAVKAPVALLDLGTGTGRVLEQFAPYFSDIIAVEPDADMLAIAQRRLAPYPAHFANTAAEDMKLPRGWQASLVTICRAFHWMDQQRVLRLLEPHVARTGTIAVFSDNSFWQAADPWSKVVREILQAYLGPERRTMLGTYKPPREYFGETFVSSVFTRIERHSVPVVRTWSLDEIIGYLYSTSFASHAVLGAKAEHFERELRAALAGLSPENSFVEHNQFDILLASREDSGSSLDNF